jgi:hypothetical protein
VRYKYLFPKPKGHISHTTSTTTTAKPRGERRRPGSKPRSSTARPAAEAPPSAERVQLESGFGTGSGNVRFICKINLSPQETAQITIKAHLVSNTLRQKYKNAAHFKITSNAEIVANEAYTLSPGANADITTLVKLRDPSAIKQGKLGFLVLAHFMINFSSTLQIVNHSLKNSW